MSKQLAQNSYYFALALTADKKHEESKESGQIKPIKDCIHGQEVASFGAIYDTLTSY